MKRHTEGTDLTKRVITVKGDEGDVRIEVVAKVTTKLNNLTQNEVEKVVNRVAWNLFHAIADETIPYTDFGVHNTTISV